VKGDSIAEAVLSGAKVTITPDCWPTRTMVARVLVSMTKLTWNGTTTLNRNILVTGLKPEQVEAEIDATVREMAATIESPHNWKG